MAATSHTKPIICYMLCLQANHFNMTSLRTSIYGIVMLVSAQFVGYTADEGLQGQNIPSITILSNPPITEVTLDQHSNDPL